MGLRTDWKLQQLPLGTSGTVLGYNGSTTASLIGPFTGATGVANGIFGLVPQPLLGQQAMFLRGDGIWAAAGGGSGISGLTAGRVTLSTAATTIGDSADLTFNDTTNTLSVNYLDSIGFLTGIGYGQSAIGGGSNTYFLQPTGSATNIGLRVLAKGTGNLQFTNVNWGTTLLLDGTSSVLTLTHDRPTAGSAVPFELIGGAGSITFNNASEIRLKGGNAYSLSGDGNGGNVSITAGAKRALGVGVPGNVSLTSGSTNYTNLILADGQMILTANHSSGISSTQTLGSIGTSFIVSSTGNFTATTTSGDIKLNSGTGFIDLQAGLWKITNISSSGLGFSINTASNGVVYGGKHGVSLLTNLDGVRLTGETNPLATLPGDFTISSGGHTNTTLRGSHMKIISGTSVGSSEPSGDLSLWTGSPLGGGDSASGSISIKVGTPQGNGLYGHITLDSKSYYAGQVPANSVPRTAITLREWTFPVTTRKHEKRFEMDVIAGSSGQTMIDSSQIPNSTTVYLELLVVGISSTGAEGFATKSQACFRKTSAGVLTQIGVTTFVFSPLEDIFTGTASATIYATGGNIVGGFNTSLGSFRVVGILEYTMVSV